MADDYPWEGSNQEQAQGLLCRTPVTSTLQARALQPTGYQFHPSSLTASALPLRAGPEGSIPQTGACRAGMQTRSPVLFSPANPTGAITEMPAGFSDPACSAHLPFQNLLYPGSRRGRTPAGLSGRHKRRPTLPTAQSLHATYFCSILEHLGKARGLGDVKRHD